MTRATEQGREREAWMETLLRLVERLEGLGAELVRAHRTGVLTDDDDGDRLLEAVAHRQAILDEMTRCAGELAPLRDRCMASGGHEDVRRRLDGVAAAAAALAAQNARDQERLRARRDAVARQLADVERGRGALAAYGRRTALADLQDTEA
jgi:hypothetical protein